MSSGITPYRLLPSIDRLMRLQDGVDVPVAREAARRLVEELKQRMGSAWPPEGGVDAVLGEDALAVRLGQLSQEVTAPWHARVLNATGILLHTGLGRAPLSATAVHAVQEVAAQGFVEVERESGKRNRREHRIAEHLCVLTGAEAATVVNNNAGATLLALDAMARGLEVPVSRGELVEIGGGFRMPDVMHQAGCTLVEIGTTNRTRASDYQNAINERTGCLLKVHPSNYRIDGFHGEVGLAELVKIGTRNHLPVIEDLGSGLMLEEKLPHDARESNVPASVRTGADLVCFSGDKLFGSCQAGILVGKRAAIARVAGHPLYRALRVDKLALAALEATLLTYRFGEPKRDIPILRAIWAPLEEIEAEATALQAEIGEPARLLGYLASVEESLGYVGSGASPARSLQSRAVRLAPDAPRLGIEEFARRLRCAEPAVFPRIEDGSLFLDLRSLAPGQWREIVEVVAALSREEG